MIKIEIQIMEGNLEIEIKKDIDFYSLIVIISKSERFREKGRAWSGKINDEEKLLKL